MAGEQAQLVDWVVCGGRAPVYCRWCGRPLRDPVSRALWLGPECRRRLAAPRRREAAEQDCLPGLP